MNQESLAQSDIDEPDLFFIGSGGLAFYKADRPPGDIPIGMKALGDFNDERRQLSELISDSPDADLLSYPLQSTASVVEIWPQGQKAHSPQFIADPFVFRLSLDRQRQKLPDSYAGHFVDHVEVTYNGICFCVVAEAPSDWDRPDFIGVFRYDWHLYQTVEHFLTELLSSVDGYEALVIPPSLPHLRTTLRIEHVPWSASGIEVDNTTDENDHLSLVAQVHQHAVDAWTASRKVAHGLASDIGHFYGLAAQHGHRDALVQELRQSFSNTAQRYTEFASFRAWQVWRLSRFRVSGELRRSIAESLHTNATLASTQIELDAARDVFRKKTPFSSHISSAVQYLDDHISSPPLVDTAAVLAALRFYEERKRGSR